MHVGVLAYAVAFGGGIASFLSPCVLPLVPAYLAIVTGLEVGDLGQPRHAARITRDTALFVSGFGVVFVLLYLTSTAVSHAVVHDQSTLTRLSGVVVVAMAAFLAGSLVLRAPWLYQERRLHVRPSRWGPFAAPVAGAAFAMGWTPCVGPVMASVLTVASTQGQSLRGGILLAAYTAGMGVCFLAAGLAAGRLAGAFGWVKGHFTGLTLGSSTIMAFFGVLLILDRFSWVVSELEVGLQAVGLGRLISLG